MAIQLKELGQSGATTGQAAIWNVSSPNAWAPGTDFGNQSLVTTNSYILNSGTGFIRVGLVAGSGAGVASAASTGNFRIARGNPGFSMLGRNDGDTGDITLLQYSSNTGTGLAALLLGDSTNLDTLRMFAKAAGDVDINFGGSIFHTFNSGGYNLGAGSACGINFNASVTACNITQSATLVSGATGAAFAIRAQASNGPGVTVTGGSMTITAGDVNTGVSAAPSTNQQGGKLLIRAGDATTSLATSTNIGGNILMHAGRNTGGAGAADGNIGIHADPANYQAMQRGLFYGNCLAAPTGAPAAGGFMYAVGGALLWMGPSGTVTTMGAA
jgi:hypothetical protein